MNSKVHHALTLGKMKYCENCLENSEYSAYSGKKGIRSLEATLRLSNFSTKFQAPDPADRLHLIAGKLRLMGIRQLPGGPLMRVEYINPFIASVRNAFQTMLSTEVQRGSPYLRATAESDLCVSGVIGLSGDAVGTVVLNMSREVALGIASVLLLDQFSELTADVIDAVGELTNVIAGAAKSKLEEFHMNVSLPNVVTGRATRSTFPRT